MEKEEIYVLFWGLMLHRYYKKMKKHCSFTGFYVTIGSVREKELSFYEEKNQYSAPDRNVIC